MSPHFSERAIILAPHGRDAAIAASILTDAGLGSTVVNALRDLVGELERGAGFALLTEEGLRTANLNPLALWLEAQPEWSDFPFVLLTQKGGGLERNPAAKRFLDMLGNVTFLERPFHPTTMVSLAQSALRGRRRQYEARSRLEELHRGADKYRSLFESIDAGFCIIDMVFDADGRPIDYMFVEANPAFERQTGLQGAVGRTMRSMVSGHEQHWFDVYGAVARTGERVRFEQHAEALGNIWYDVYAFRVGDPDAGRVAVLFNDISERRQMELALRESEERLRGLNETLEERVVERTEALERTQEALRQSQKLESMGQLTGGVAHDFNNLLTPIVGSLDLLLRRGVGTERERKLIEGAVQSADRARTLVQRLLAFARRQPLQATAIDIGNLVGNLFDLVASTCGPRIRVAIDIADPLPPAKADANQIEMALLNLAVNARDAMPDGGTLTIGAAPDQIKPGNAARLRPGAYVRLSVTDTGSGMDADTIAKAVEPFFTTKGVGQGTGLGLSMVHGLAAQLGGGLSIDSLVGRGTRIDLWLPATDARPEQASAPLEIDDSHRDCGIALVVDDEDLVRASTAHMLSELGYTVVEAHSGEEALRLMHGSDEIDLLVTDHLMPGITGTDLATKLRELRPGMRVLVVSGYAEGKGISPDLPRLTKPFKQSDLANCLAQL
ncbi:hybrid sensor histidine kinase/response regulator [Sphingomonas bisphenolicum]|uniref:histidine kinase n=1 Tax=Sphingomonas bisphenolicum TaxID=296544 RepID=A0ABM7G7R6_9SPHN|nr:ATP-binding protein [Sphingomonas bisphenolicum]BBF71402.1 hybrid sensor histidine kinase/response regulator [Sphingomonas bisphenolicum]